MLVRVNEQIFRFRSVYIPRTQPGRRTLEVVVLTVVTSTIWFAASYWSPCALRPTTAYGTSLQVG